MGSCSTKRISRRAYSGEIIKIKNQLTPCTSESSNLHHFPSHFSKPDSILSHFFEAFGSFPSRFDEAFAPKPIEFRGSGNAEMLISAKLCVTSRKGLKDGLNQDNFCVVSNPSFFAMAVFDGHGDNGHVVSALARKSLVKNVMEVGWEKMTEAFNLTEKEICEKAQSKKTDCRISGSTATLVTIVHNMLTVAHIGDSRAILVKKYVDKLIAVPLTLDHKADDVIEKNRIEAAGGKIEKSIREVARIYVPGGEYALAVSRSFGDTLFKTFGVICEPFTRKIRLDENDAFIVIATDGLWDVVDNYEVAEVLKLNDCRNACRKLEKLAWDRWIKIGAEAVDDISIMILNLSL